NGPELIGRMAGLNLRQETFAASVGGQFIGPLATGGSRAISHNYIVENVARAGDVVVGTDSHTCVAGAGGALAIGVGATDIANAWFSREILVQVPEVIRINVRGRLRTGVCAKDLALWLLANPELSKCGAAGRVLLFAGRGCADLPVDERMTLCSVAA